MPLFNWGSQYETGIFVIDVQHKKLVEAINNLHDAMKEGKGKDKAQSILDFLVDYTVQHFNTEENLMKQKNYSDYTNHKFAHDKLVKEVAEMRSRYIEGKVLPMQLSGFLTDWLKNHILNTDKKYVPFLKN